jgi:CDGSH iron-sulfur domain-containing protein 3
MTGSAGLLVGRSEKKDCKTMADLVPVIAERSPIGVKVEEGKDYWWCACGRSQNQPFCDGSHKGTGFSPVQFKAEKSEEVWFCRCKNTANTPRCDGSHKRV